MLPKRRNKRENEHKANPGIQRYDCIPGCLPMGGHPLADGIEALPCAPVEATGAARARSGSGGREQECYLLL